MQLQAACCGGGVNRLSQRPERNVSLFEARNQIDQVAEAAAEAIQSPHHQRVTRAEVVETGVELWAMADRSGADVAEDADAPGLLKRVELQREILAARGRTGVADQLAAVSPPRSALVLPVHRYSCILVCLPSGHRQPIVRERSDDTGGPNTGCRQRYRTAEATPPLVLQRAGALFGCS